MAFSRGPRGRATRSRRSVSWTIGVADVDGSFSASGKAVWSFGATPTGNEETIVRTRGLVAFYNESANAIGSGWFGAVGIGIVSDQAFAAGATSMPGPLADEDWDWIWHSYFDVRAISATIADGVNAFSCAQRIVIDSKAMRKIGPNETLFGMTEVVESGAGTLEIQAQTRTLVKQG